MARWITAEPAELWDRFDDDLLRWVLGTRLPEVSGLSDRTAYPAFDVLENEDGLTVWADIPGVKPQDLEVSIAGTVLTIQGEKKAETAEGRLWRDETWTGSFRRSIALPDTVDPQQVNAEHRDGVLRVTVARRAEHRPRPIPVKTH